MTVASSECALDAEKQAYGKAHPPLTGCLTSDSTMPEPASQVPGGLRLHRWNEPAVITLALLAMAAGFGQFGVIAALANVARSFGRVGPGATIADQAGLSGTDLGVGLAIIRLASLGGLPLAGLADRIGRRKVLIWTCAIGLGLTVLAAASPSYWWFVAIFAVGRPPLSATSAVAQVGAAEETSSADRAKAIALIAAGYAVGTGLVAVVHGIANTALGFRGLLGLALVPLLLLPVLSRRLEEPDRFVAAEAGGTERLPVLGAIERPYRGRLAIVALLAFAVAVVTGPANSFVFVYAQSVLKMSAAMTAAMVVGAGAIGLGGLLAGRWLADHVGRRITAGCALGVLAVCAIIAYSGSRIGLVAGYELGVFSGATFAPAAGALSNELFPTSVRASVAGWQVAAGVLGATVGLVEFGAMADVGNRFGFAGLVTFAPIVLVTVLFRALPETRGKEPEDLWHST